MRSKPTPTIGPNSDRNALTALVSIALGLFAIYVYTSFRDNLLAPVAIFFTLYSIAYVAYVYASVRVAPAAAAFNWLPWFIIGSGAVFRLVLVHSVPTLSTDMYRYLWDGQLTAHGINPFRWTPLDPRLSPLRDSRIWVPMEYKPYQTVYMSVSQAFFFLGHVLFGMKLWGFKLMYTTLDIGVMLLLRILLIRLGQPAYKVVWYAWCPLPIIEISLSGHQDVVGVFFLLLAFVLYSGNKTRSAALSIAAATLTKGFALLLIPLFMRKSGWRFGLYAGAALVVLGLPQLIEAPAFLHGMKQYLNNVQVNGSIHAMLDGVLYYYTNKHIELANEITDLMIIICVGSTLWRPIESLADLVRRALIIVCSCLLLVPTLFAWYLVWIIPLSACVGKRPSAGLILLTGTVLLSYSFYFSHETFWWAAWAEYLPVYALLAWEWVNGYWGSVEEAKPSTATATNDRAQTLGLDAAGMTAEG